VAATRAPRPMVLDDVSMLVESGLTAGAPVCCSCNAFRVLLFALSSASSAARRLSLSCRSRKRSSACNASVRFNSSTHNHYYHHHRQQRAHQAATLRARLLCGAALASAAASFSVLLSSRDFFDRMGRMSALQSSTGAEREGNSRFFLAMAATVTSGVPQSATCI
jgi:hypothetical protein